MTLTTVASLAALTVACGLNKPDFTGVWRPDDGTATKIINDGGRCSDMYYSNGKVLDIGGPETCTFSSGKDGQGRYTLVVEQPPNKETLSVTADGDDSITIWNESIKIVTLTRQ